MISEIVLGIKLTVCICFNPELPESKILDFDCGVQIKMDFAAEFSNVLVIYTSIVKKSEEMLSCQAHITNLPLVSGLFVFILKKESAMHYLFISIFKTSKILRCFLSNTFFLKYTFIQRECIKLIKSSGGM